MLLYAGLYMAPLAYPFLDMLSISVSSRHPARQRSREIEKKTYVEKGGRRGCRLTEGGVERQIA